MHPEAFHHYQVKIPELDRQHWELISLMNQIKYDDKNIGKVFDDKCKSILAKINENLISHFAYEEQLMEDLKYPYAKPHIRNHVIILKKIIEIIELENDNHQYKSLLITKLEEIIIHHIEDHDMQIGTFARK